MSIFLRKLNIAHNIFCKYTYKKENHQIFSKDIFQNISTQKEKKGKNLYPNKINEIFFFFFYFIKAQIGGKVTLFRSQ